MLLSFIVPMQIMEASGFKIDSVLVKNSSPHIGLALLPLQIVDRRPTEKLAIQKKACDDHDPTRAASKSSIPAATNATFAQGLQVPSSFKIDQRRNVENVIEFSLNESLLQVGRSRKSGLKLEFDAQATQRKTKRQKIMEGNWLNVDSRCSTDHHDNIGLHRQEAEAANGNHWRFGSCTSNYNKSQRQQLINPACKSSQIEKSSSGCFLASSIVDRTPSSSDEIKSESCKARDTEKRSALLQGGQASISTSKNFDIQQKPNAEESRCDHKQMMMMMMMINSRNNVLQDEDDVDDHRSKTDDSACKMKQQVGGQRKNNNNVVSRASSADRHSKVCTARGILRDRRVRLSPSCAMQLFDIQDRLGVDQPSKAVDWLLEKAKTFIEQLPLLPHVSSSCTHHNLNQFSADHLFFNSTSSKSITNNSCLTHLKSVPGSSNSEALTLRLSNSTSDIHDPPSHDLSVAPAPTNSAADHDPDAANDQAPQLESNPDEHLPNISLSKSRAESRAKARERARERVRERISSSAHHSER